MRRTLLAALSACSLVFAGSALAQDEEAEGPSWFPVETLACDFNEGKSMADLLAVTAEWNAWLDEKGVTDYYGAIVTPQYYGEWKMDVGWLGAWKDGHAMGAGTDVWVTEGGELGGKFAEVLTCNSHTNFATATLRPAPGDDEEGDDTFVMEFTNCKMHESQTFDTVMAGLGAWTAYQAENDFQNSRFIMFPVYGESNNDYVFKLIDGYDDHTALGADYELMGNGGHWRKRGELLAELIECDIPRLYDARQVRDWSDAEADE